MYPISKHLRLDQHSVLISSDDLRGRQAVQDIVRAGAVVAETNFFQLASVHELDALAQLAFLEAGGVLDQKMVIQNFQSLQAVDAVNSR